MVRFVSDWAPYGPSAHDPYLFQVDYRAASPHPTLSQPIDIAVDLFRSLSQPLTVMVSGGVDSQAVAYAAKLSGIDCRFVSFRYNGGINDYDIDCPFWASHGIDVEVRDIDILAFHETELMDWGHRYECGSPHILCHMKIASEVEGPVVFSGNIVAEYTGHLSINTLALERFAKISGRPVLGYFLNCDPHLVYSFRQHTKADIERDAYAEKVSFYQASGFPVEPQEKKFHGFERIKELYDERKVSPLARIKFKDAPSKRPYDLLFRYPLKKYNPFRDVTHIFE